MEEDSFVSKVPFISGLGMKKCRYMVCGSIPFAMLFSTPFVLLFSYYNTQNQAPFKKWNVKLLFKDFMLGWVLFVSYATLRTLYFDPYCDPKSVHYNPNANAFERKNRALQEMQDILEKEGKVTK
mmetsp:Transcript_6253/g.9280  ORF Transcript_6253/g.9280 Transcript_6253/m.9280 type:complete len:125 (-) Transcript_6253:26-400(-)